MRIQFAKNAYNSRSKPLSAQTCINLYADRIPADDAKTTTPLYGTPGLKLWLDLGQNSGIALTYVMGNFLYVVLLNGAVYRIAQDKSTVALGNIGATGGIVSAADNGTQLVVVNNYGAGFVITASVVVAITDPDFLPASSVTYLDGYHLFTEINSQVFFISELFDAVNYDALDFASAIRRSDNLVAAQRVNDQIWLFGTESIEIYYNSGAAAFPIQQIQGGTIQKGCAAKGSIQAINTGVIWLGNDKVIYASEGVTPTKISTPAIDFQINQYQNLELVSSFTYAQEGHIFYGITFPESGGATWVYDTVTGLWHQRKSFNIDIWRCNTTTQAFGLVLAGDYITGKIYELDLDTYDENGEPLVAEAVSPPIWLENARFTMYNTRIDFESGVGINLGQGSDPQIMLDFSDDGGRTFGNEHWRPMGKAGEYNARAVWRRLGQSRERYLRIRISDPVKRVILGAYTELEVNDG